MFVRIMAMVLLLMTSSLVLAEGKVAVSDLQWMTGSWRGALGPNVLEENWIAPDGNTIGALVRSTSGGATTMIEMIVIEEENDTLVLRLQQWNPGYVPRSPAPQTMTLVESVPNKVSFRATTPGGLAGLTYSRPDDNTFQLDIDTGKRVIVAQLKKLPAR